MMSNSIKVAHIFWGLTLGGIETMLVNIINNQVKCGADVTLLVINDTIHPELSKRLNPKVKILNVGRRIGSRTLSFIGRLNRMLDEVSPDVVHLHSAAIYNFLNTKWRKRACDTIHALPHGKMGVTNRWVNLALWMLSPSGNVRAIHTVPHVYAISDAVRTALLEKHGVESVVVVNGIDASVIRKRDGRKATEPFRIVQVSRLEMAEKGQDLLLKAIALLRRGGMDITVTFVGGGGDERTLKMMAKELEIAGYVTFAGSCPPAEVYQTLKDFDLFVQPSRKEGFGLTVTEAMAACVPVLVSSGQGPAQIVEQGRLGWIFENGDYKDLARAIEHIIKHYDEALSKVPLALEQVEKYYDISVTARNYLGLYEQIIKENR